MLNKLLSFMRQHKMVTAGDRVICAVSGGADSVALLFAMYLLAPKLNITLEAAHYNHCLRGTESDDDARFVADLCDRLDIPVHMGQGNVVAGKKGLEAAARSARYAFLESLPGKIATAHTADDNAETVLMHLIRGTGLRGLGGITPVRGNVLRPMLTVTRQEVVAFLQEYNLTWREDSTNSEDDFLRNRIRHRVMPLLKEENPSLPINMSHMALCLREDEQLLSAQVDIPEADVGQLRALPYSIRSRWIVRFLQDHGIPEPEKEHVGLIDKLIFSQNPSASADLPGGIVVTRCYDKLHVVESTHRISTQILQIPCKIRLPQQGVYLSVSQATALSRETASFTVAPKGQLVLRSRQQGDSLRLPGGTKTLKKLFIDKKIPAMRRDSIPVIADDMGVLAVLGFGPNLDRLAHGLPAVEIRFEKIDTEDVTDGSDQGSINHGTADPG